MMEELSKSHCDVNSFGRWQSMYAERGIATFPIGPNKKPLVSRYNRFGLRASAEIGRKYADAPAIGFMAGKRNRITIGDVDEVGEKPLQHFLDRHGSSPVIARTASGKHHVWYRHNNERRLIRPNREILTFSAAVSSLPRHRAEIPENTNSSSAASMTSTSCRSCRTFR